MLTKFWVNDKFSNFIFDTIKYFPNQATTTQFKIPSGYLKKYPVCGELACAIWRAGIRPAKNASRPATTA